MIDRSLYPYHPEPSIDNIPAELRAVAQWVCWRRQPKPDGSTTKVPVSVQPDSNGRRGGNASSTDPATWAPFPLCVAYHATHLDTIAGVGIVVTDADDLVGVDLDHVLTPGETEPDYWTHGIIQRLNSYTEISPSGSGLRIFVRGKLPPGRRKLGPFEVYESGRFLTVTGNPVIGSPAGINPDATAARAEIHRVVFGDPEPPRVAAPRPAHPLSMSDRDLLDRAFDATNGAAFRALWDGATGGYGGDDSAADLALCAHLAFWTGGAAGQIDALFRQSGLMRNKWDARHSGDGRTYGQMTVDQALTGTTAFYTGAAPVGAPPASGPNFAGEDAHVDDVALFLGG